MKIFIANDSKQGLGGGWSFISNFIRGAQGLAEFVDTIRDCDVVFIPASSMVRAETLDLAKALNKPVFLRVDNVPRNSRNRNTGTSRLLSYFEAAKGVIFQSRWATQFVGEWLAWNCKKTGPTQTIIYNGVDTEIFNPGGPKESDQRGVYLYSRINRDETKNWHVTWYEYQLIHRKWEESDKETAPPELWLTGQFSPELVEYNFDFFQGEVVRYFGAIEDQRQYANILRSASYLLAPYYNDACSNSIIEALACGVGVETFGWGHTGGTPELFKLNEEGFDWSHRRMAKEYIDFMQRYA